MPKVTSKLQITLPKRLAQAHGIVPGDEVHFESAAGVIRMVPAGSLPQALSLEERLRLFDEASRRVGQRAQAGSGRGEPGRSPARGWRRDELYERGPAD